MLIASVLSSTLVSFEDPVYTPGHPAGQVAQVVPVLQLYVPELLKDG